MVSRISCNFATEKENYMNDLEPIIRKIYVIRGQRVMLDRDLAELQGQKANTSARPEIGYAAVKKQREKAA